MSRHKKNRNKPVDTTQSTQVKDNKPEQKTPPAGNNKPGQKKKMPDWEAVRVLPYEIDEFISAYDKPLDGNEWLEAILAYQFGVEPNPNTRIGIFYAAYREALENGVTVEEVLGLV